MGDERNSWKNSKNPKTFDNEIKATIRNESNKWIKLISYLDASMSSKMVPLVNKFLNSNNECSDRVATWGFDQRLLPSSTSSSNLTHLKEQTRLSGNKFSVKSLFSVSWEFFSYIFLNDHGMVLLVWPWCESLLLRSNFINLFNFINSFILSIYLILSIHYI